MAARRRVQSTQAASGRPSPQYYPPIYPPDAPDYDYGFNPQLPPRSDPPSSSFFTSGPSTLAVPEPQLYRSTSAGSIPSPRPALTISDYGAGGGLLSPYDIPEDALDPASFGYGARRSASTGGFPNPYGNGRQFSESSYSFGGGDAYSFSTSESPDRSPSVTFSQLR